MVEKIKKLANERGMSIFALETKANVGNGTISRWNNSKPNLSTLEKIAKVLEVSVEELLE